jgi:hypothetical protein
LARIHGNGLKGIGIICFYFDVINFFTNGKCSIAGQGPGCSGPCKDKNIAGIIGEKEFALLVPDYFELCGNRVVLHIAVAAGLVQFMGA